MADDVAQYRPGDHLLTLIERAGAAAGRVGTVPPDVLAAAQPDAVREQARLSVILDGSPIEDDTAEEVDRQVREGRGTTWGEPTAAVEQPGGWATALRMDGLATQEIAGREYANLLACARVETEVAATFFDQPLHAITALHSAICDGLVEPADIARLRQTERAIHDGAQGQMLWMAPDPDRIPALMDSLLEWLGRGSASRPTLVVAAVAHERLLEWQPFEAANGRLARSVARVIRRARGLDAAGLAVPERYWRRQTLAYHREVAATIRRRGDLTRWIDTAVHAEALALEAVADAQAGTQPVTPPQQLADFIATLGDGAAITAKHAAERLGVSRERARADLVLARRAGLVEDDLTVAAPRFRVVATPHSRAAG